MTIVADRPTVNNAPAGSAPLVSLDTVAAGLSPMGRAAARLADAGMAVFPLQGKQPLIPKVHPEGDPLRKTCRGECGQLGHGFWDATRELLCVAAWWARWPEANIGVYPARSGRQGLLVIDLDGPEARQSWIDLQREHGRVDTLVSLTGRDGGGAHVWFRAPAGVAIGNSRGTLPKHIDIRCAAGYVVAAPSVHPDTGRRYRWREPVATRLADTPAWLVEILTTRPEPPKRAHHAARALPPCAPRDARILAGLVEVVLNTPEGSRNDTLNWAAYRCGEHVAKGRIDAEEGRRALMLAGEAAGLTSAEVAATVASGLKASA